MAVADREALSLEMRRHAMVVAVLSDPETTESLHTALNEQEQGLEVPFADLRRKYGTQRAG